MRRLNRDEVMQIWRLGDCEKFVSIDMWSVIWPGKNCTIRDITYLA